MGGTPRKLVSEIQQNEHVKVSEMIVPDISLTPLPHIFNGCNVSQSGLGGGWKQVRSSKWSSNVVKWVSCYVRVKTDHLLCVKSYCQRLGTGDLFPFWSRAFCHFALIINLKLVDHLKLSVLLSSASCWATGCVNIVLPSDVLSPCKFVIFLSMCQRQRKFIRCSLWNIWFWKTWLSDYNVTI